MNAEKARQLSPELQVALEPLLAAIESLSERIYAKFAFFFATLERALILVALRICTAGLLITNDGSGD